MDVGVDGGVYCVGGDADDDGGSVGSGGAAHFVE